MPTSNSAPKPAPSAPLKPRTATREEILQAAGKAAPHITVTVGKK